MTPKTTLWLSLLLGALAVPAAATTTYVWPLSNSASPDAMNTSFGPRVNNSKWDFHDGMDLPGACGTNVRAVAGGTIVAAGNASPPSWASRHVLLKVADDDRGDVYVYYLHLQSFAVATGAVVARGDVLGQLGQDDASYCHLHLEARFGNPNQASSRHPLLLLPYGDSDNLSAPGSARFNRQANDLMAARLVFGLTSKNEGDLAKVEVDLKHGATVLATRRVDFDDKTTINEGNDDALAFVGDIAVEGYQSSDMVGDGRTDLQYGVVVRNLPADCDTLSARVFDLGNHVRASADIPVPAQTAVEHSLSFDDGVKVPAGWTGHVSTSGSGTSIANDSTVAHGGCCSLKSTDSDGGSSAQQAALERGLASGRFQWLAEAWLRAETLDLAADTKQVYLLTFLDTVTPVTSPPTAPSTPPAGAARLQQKGAIYAGIADRKADGITTGGLNGTVVIGTGSWRKWTLQLLRVGTRETTAVLLLDGAEVVRHSWDTTVREPAAIRVGVGYGNAKVKTVLNTDDVVVTERAP